MMNHQQSPLFIPALWEGNHFKILDETMLPWKIEYITVHNVAQAVQAVKDMKTRAFGQVMTFFYSATLLTKAADSHDCDALRARLNELSEEFTRARPTFDFSGLGRLLDGWLAEIPAGARPGKWLEGRIREHLTAMPKRRMERARRAAELLPDSCRLLTHCNVSGEVVAVAQCGRELGKRISVIATETRPYLQGSRLTAWEMAQAGIPVAVVPDCAIAQLMAKGEIDAVLVGADRVAQNGDIINKVGTYPLALVARKYGIPFHALVQTPGPLASGAEALIEERPVSELLTFQGRVLVPGSAGEIAGRYPAFDVTPSRLIAALISFEGTFTPQTFRAKYEIAAVTKENEKKPGEKFLLIYGLPKKSDYAYFSRALKADGCQSVLVPEMRPELWGAHVITRELRERNIPMTFISDNMMGTFFANGQITRVCLFYTELRAEAVVGICGSLLAAVLARAHGVPVELFSCGEPEWTPQDRDVTTFLGQRVCCEGVGIYGTERDLIPWPLFNEQEARMA